DFLKFLDLTFPTPEQNLACDEALLDLCEEGKTGELLRFWESEKYFVVLGSSNKFREEVNVEACELSEIPILRRHSGGGTVLQGPGCLNFSLILNIDPSSPTRNITETTRYIMQRHAEVFSNLLGEMVEMKGSSDLTIDGKKFSGNAQRRRMKALLFHGTFLLDFDLNLIEKYLQSPAKQPDYREQRNHLDFVRNISAGREQIKLQLQTVWDATTLFEHLPHGRIKELVNEKYSDKKWIYKN
ncbi:MAG: lipoate--protein ligase family protein, partial [bacterium]